MKPLYITLLSLILTVPSLAQDGIIALSFTGKQGIAHRQLDSIYVRNLDRGGDTVLFWPDTVLMLEYPVGIQEKGGMKNTLAVRAYPNPFLDRCLLEIDVEKEEGVIIVSSDLLGRMMILFDGVLDAGRQQFEFLPGEQGFYAIRIMQDGKSAGVKLVNAGTGQGAPRLYYRGKIADHVYHGPLKTNQGGFEYEAGDSLLYLGYSQGEESGTSDVPYESRLYSLQYAYGGSCPDDSLVYYEGKYYHTVQVKNQCWFRQNLNVGIMINGMSSQTNNGILEKYCIANDALNCETYGALYQWNEMMAYSETEGSRGICPLGWHIPTDNDWLMLESAIDSQYGYRDDEEWDQIGFRGSDVGNKLKSDSLWVSNGNGSNLSGFNALPGGTRGSAGFFLLLGENAPLWSSTPADTAYVLYRVLVYNSDRAYRFSFDRYSGFGVRCLRDH